MARYKTNRRKDQRLFKKTANRTRASNLYGANMMRGGLMR